MTANKKTARLAGLLYLLVVVFGIFSLLYVPSQLIIFNDSATTLSNIKSSNFLFRLGIVAESISFTAFLLLPLVLYKLLHFVNKPVAVTMVALAVPSVPILFSNLMNKFAILSSISNDHIPTGQLQEQVMFYLTQFNYGNLIGQNFWALWLFPFGYLVYKSGILPKLLGVFLMVGSIGYYLDFLGRIMIENYYDYAISSYITIPASIGEIGTCLWLLIAGAKTDKPAST
ncbi:DUF4386 domain-containing protein [Allomuricauda sp. SCSIO 65647]|uniref:DUF4386 domain-containing protein n=1 Tax=Allomuricauda sp. SCSIO 65647 TaxID=2908843 RepID=UPI001F2A30AA|nr:DUF4386 domain-containing protein [Muricauda sp. SCSIO 65647]UJH66630.1 DUF4386 domain-containing protein [Muricauda sp. SCSIO 65647]